LRVVCPLNGRAAADGKISIPVKKFRIIKKIVDLVKIFTIVV